MSQLFSHSAEVEMWLDCGEHGRVDLSRITPKSVVAKEARHVPPCIAELVVCVDGRCRRIRVNVSRGFANGRLATAIYPLSDDVAPF
jgi:hypothetical protein